ncbi:thrombomodulin-like [Lepisosteus oculatus]|uniref:thrombomodulin-like n=1 Tax=Lepisosteus oculatus TaxID=7918 RepID=UPI0035F50FA9
MESLMRILATVQFILQITGKSAKSGVCVGNACYSINQDSTTFQTAKNKCELQGNLMTVRSSVSNEVLAVLIANSKADFWIGLQRPAGRCTDNTAKLRGYVWVTEDENTDFTNWENSVSACSRQCVSVSSDLKWKERSCQDEVDGFLCEYNFNKTCDPLPQDFDEFILYKTPLGIKGEDLASIPPGSIATLKPSDFKVLCVADETNSWIQGPWSCEFENGGCEHQCRMKNGKPECICPPNEELKGNKLNCNKMNLCVNSDCEHLCVNHNDSYTCLCEYGFKLEEDGKRCRDIDDCELPGICGHEKVCVNTPGSFECRCPDGYEDVKGECEDIDECLNDVCQQECENVMGSYKCSCFQGYMQRNENTSKCELYCSSYECPAVCDPNVYWMCKCPDGFVLDQREDGLYCVDIDECESGTYCSHFCNNTFGSYSCYCEKGFYLLNNFLCVSEEEKVGSTTTIFSPVVSGFVTPTSNYTVDDTYIVTPGVLFGIVICTVVIILVLIFFLHWVYKNHVKAGPAFNPKKKDLRVDPHESTEMSTDAGFI